MSYTFGNNKKDMKTLALIITLFTMAHLCADPKEPSEVSPAKSPAELKRDIAELEKQLLKLKTRLAEMERELSVSVPVEPRKGDIVINVLPDGNVTIDKVKLSRVLLEKKLRHLSTVSKDVAVCIRGGSKVKYQTIVEVIDLCQKIGIHNISFATEKQKK